MALNKAGKGSAGELAQGLNHAKTYVLLPGLSLGFLSVWITCYLNNLPTENKTLAVKTKQKKGQFQFLHSNLEVKN